MSYFTFYGTVNELSGEYFSNVTTTDRVLPCLRNRTPSTLDRRDVYFLDGNCRLGRRPR